MCLRLPNLVILSHGLDQTGLLGFVFISVTIVEEQIEYKYKVIKLAISQACLTTARQYATFGNLRRSDLHKPTYPSSVVSHQNANYVAPLIEICDCSKIFPRTRCLV